MSKNIKKVVGFFIIAVIAISLVACSTNQKSNNNGPNDEVCPGKQPGVAGNAPVPAQGFDLNENMDFKTIDTLGKEATNSIFSDAKRGVWLVFWQTDNDKSKQELERLNNMIENAEQNGYKIVGVVMDGEKHLNKAKEMTKEIKFTNLVFNSEMKAIYKDIPAFFDGTVHKKSENEFKTLQIISKPGDPISTRANNRGQIQTSCYLVSPSDEKLLKDWINNDSNLTYEELKRQEQDQIKKDK